MRFVDITLPTIANTQGILTLELLKSIVQAGKKLEPVVEAFVSADTLDSDNNVALCDASSGTFIITLPTAVGISGKIFDIVKIEASEISVVIATTSGQTIGTRPSSNIALNRLNDYIRVVSDGTNWEILSKKETEILTAVASGTISYTGRTDADFLASSADVPLGEGIWMLRAYFSVSSGTGTSIGIRDGSGLYSADGADSAATPATLVSGTNIASVNGDPTLVEYSSASALTLSAAGTNQRSPAGFVEVVVVVDGGTETVFAVPQIAFSTTGAAFTEAYIRAERIW